MSLMTVCSGYWYASVIHLLRSSQWFWPDLINPSSVTGSHGLLFFILMVLTERSHAQLLVTTRSSMDALIVTSIGMQMWPSAWPVPSKRNSSSLGQTMQLASLVQISVIQKTNMTVFCVCHKEKNASAIMFCLKACLTSVKTREWLKNCLRWQMGQGSVSDKWGHTESQAVGFINFPSYSDQLNCTKLLGLMYYFQWKLQQWPVPFTIWLRCNLSQRWVNMREGLTHSQSFEVVSMPQTLQNPVNSLVKPKSPSIIHKRLLL